MPELPPSPVLLDIENVLLNHLGSPDRAAAIPIVTECLARIVAVPDRRATAQQLDMTIGQLRAAALRFCVEKAGRPRE